MNDITAAFGVLAWIMGALLLVLVVGAVFYMRWRAAGQERGV